jgi:hypothetical protein
MTIYTLAAKQITAVVASEAQTAITGLDVASAVGFEAAWTGGAGGTSAHALIQTSYDGGTTWRDLQRFDFTTSAAVKHAKRSAITTANAAAYSALSAEGQNDIPIGDQLRCVVISVGVFTGAGGTLSVRAMVH